jgi:hypothetical protein
MRKDKEIAIDMRKSGKSYNEIVTSLRISKSTLSGWFGDTAWSKEVREKNEASMRIVHTIRLRALNEIRGRNLARAYDEARAEARLEFEILKHSPLFVAGVMLYWGEGDKLTKYSTRLTNTDPEMIRLYVTFLKQVCQIPEGKIKGHILIYPDLDEAECRRYWVQASGIEAAQFCKTTTIQGKHMTRRIKYGVCMVEISSTYFKVKMLEWLKLMPKELMSRT